MGEMADYALGQIMDIEESEYETDTESSYPNIPRGPGPCPVCSGRTYKITNGPYGTFYGCCNFPKCRGTRKI